MFCANALRGERPRYGGSMTVATSIPIAPLTSDPLVFEGFRRGSQARAALAAAWTHDASFRRWTFTLRGGVTTHEGAPLTAQAAAEALAPMFPDRRWNVEGASGLVVQSARPMPRLLAELAQPGAAIAGTGPFQTEKYEAGRSATLRAVEAYWGGRPYLDSIELRFGSTARAQAADLSELAPVDIRRQSQRGRRTWISDPLDLVALVFDPQRRLAQSESVRRGLAASVDRAPIANVILQKHGEPTAAIVPNALSGYGFLFNAARDAASARRLLASTAGPLLVACDPVDPVLKPIADRIALNAREAGLVVRVVDRVPADVHLRRVPGEPLDPFLALPHYARALGLPDPPPAASLEELYASERALLEGGWVAPLFHIPVIYGMAERVRNWPSRDLPPWRFEDVWLADQQ
ncbi:MAG: ABC transporter substrate-binding protein [Bryobacteraceae bacterium]